MSSFAERVLSIPVSSKTARSAIAARSTELPSDAEDAVLMTRLQEGDIAALALLYDRYCTVILRLGSRLLRDATEAEDLLQDVFLYLFRNSRAFDVSKGRVGSWLIQITYGRFLDRRKWLKKKFFDQQCDSAESTLTERTASDLNPEELAELSSWRSYFMNAFNTLPARQSEAIRLHFFEGYSLLEISQRTGDSLPSVRHLYYRGLEGLRNRLSADGFLIRREL